MQGSVLSFGQKVLLHLGQSCILEDFDGFINAIQAVQIPGKLKALLVLRAIVVVHNQANPSHDRPPLPPLEDGVWLSLRHHGFCDR